MNCFDTLPSLSWRHGRLGRCANLVELVEQLAGDCRADSGDQLRDAKAGHAPAWPRPGWNQLRLGGQRLVAPQRLDMALQGTGSDGVGGVEGVEGVEDRLRRAVIALSGLGRYNCTFIQ